VTPEQWRQVEIHFAELNEVAPGARAQRLAAIPDPSIREEVASLLENSGDRSTIAAIAGVIGSIAGRPD
jgi:hypothetical protein